MTHQWSAGEVVHIKRVHLQFEVNTVSVLCAANEGKCMTDKHRHCVQNNVSCLCGPHRQ